MADYQANVAANDPIVSESDCPFEPDEYCHERCAGVDDCEKFRNHKDCLICNK